MVVDAVIHHWVVLLTGEEAGPASFRLLVQCLAEFFYANYILLASPRPSRIQAALDVLEGLFYRVGLHTNFNKKVEMLCQPCHIVD